MISFPVKWQTKFYLGSRRAAVAFLQSSLCDYLVSIDNFLPNQIINEAVADKF